VGGLTSTAAASAGLPSQGLVQFRLRLPFLKILRAAFTPRIRLRPQRASPVPLATRPCVAESVEQSPWHPRAASIPCCWSPASSRSSCPLRRAPTRKWRLRPRSELPTAKSPTESLAVIRVPAGFEVQLVAAEPLVKDPIDIAWGADGKSWVVEMADYPLGLDGKGQPGGKNSFSRVNARRWCVRQVDALRRRPALPDGGAAVGAAAACSWRPCRRCCCWKTRTETAARIGAHRC
jgi:hypothetical protein